MFSTCVQDNNTGNTRIDPRCKVIPTLNTFKNSIKRTFLNQIVKKEAEGLKMFYIPVTELHVDVLSCNVLYPCQ